MKLLFIDDEQTFLKYLAKRLVIDGFSVKTTFSGEEGVDAASKENFDVAVVDLQMPGIDGIEVQRRLKDLQPNLPCWPWWIFRCRGLTGSKSRGG